MRLIAGEIPYDDVMNMCIMAGNYTQSFQSTLGYDWAVDQANGGKRNTVMTNNDHFFNGVRRAVKNGEVPFEQVHFEYWTVQEDGNTTIAHVGIDSHGSINSWPRGFFDQMNDDLLELI